MQDPEILDLFRQEVVTQTEALSEGLLEFEQDTEDLALIEPLMRAAHSLKGASRIIGLDVYSELAHKLEDCFVAAQKEEIKIDVSHFDSFLAVIDFLGSPAKLDNALLVKWPQGQESEVEAIRKRLDAILKGERNEEVKTTVSSKAEEVVVQESRPIEGRKVELDEEVKDSLLKAFKKEVLAQATRIKEYLEHSLESPDRSLDYSFLMTAAIAIKSSCNLAHQKEHVQQAIDLEKLFTQALKDSKELTEVQKREVIGVAEMFIAVAGEKGDVPEAHVSAVKEVEVLSSTPLQTRGVELGEEVQASLEKVFKEEVLAQATLIKEYLEKSLESKECSLDYKFLLTAATAIKSSCNLSGKKEHVAKAVELEKLFTQAKKEGRELREKEKLRAIYNAQVFIAVVKGEAIPVLEEDVEEVAEEQVEAPEEQEEAVVEENVPVKVDKKPVVISRGGDSVVRVSAANLNRLMSLAAELLVETQRLAPLKNTIVHSRVLFEQQKKLLDNFILNAGEGDLEDRLKVLKASLQEGNQYFLKNFQKQLDVFEDFSKNNSLLSSKLYNEVLVSRMRPFQECSKAYPRLVRDLARMLNKKIKLEILGEKTPVDRDILEKLDAPLNHLLRNACDHGLEAPEVRKENGKDEVGTITLEARHASGMLLLTISDDGKGIDKEAVLKKVLEKKLLTEEMAATLSTDEILDFLFLPGFSTAKEVSEVSGRGVGLDVVRTLMQEVGGDVRVESSLGKGTKFLLHLPITRSVMRVIMVDICGEPYAFPLSKIRQVLKVHKRDTKTLEGHSYFHYEGQNIAMVCANQALGFEMTQSSEEEVPVVILGNQNHPYSLTVSAILGETELVVRPLDALLGKVPCVAAASTTKQGAPVLIADVEDILTSVEKLLAGGAIQEAFSERKKINVPHILVVDDSPTVCETQRQLLLSMGFSVEVARDGVDAWNVIQNKSFDLIITDIDMPRMNGFELLQKIKEHQKYKKIPVVVVSYKDRPEDRLQGKTLGAEVYLTKSSFRDSTFGQVVREILGV